MTILISFLVIFFFSITTSFAHSEVFIIKMTTNGFEPQELTLDVQSTVIFVNEDLKQRWPASDIHPTHDIYPQFDPKKSIEPGQSWSFKPQKIGTFKFHDHLLPHFRGTLIVTGEAGSEVEVQKSNFFSVILNAVKDLSIYLRNIDVSDIKSEILRRFTPSDDDVDLASISKLSPNEQFNLIKDTAKKNGVDNTWKAFKEKFKGQGGSTGNIHDLAHLIGSLIYQDKGFGGIAICSSDFAFGCYHGFLDTAFKNSLDDLSKAEEACSKLGISGPFASCIHGIGHGVASFYQTSDLRVSLKSCLRLDPKGREYCYDGVFMEFARSAPISFYKKDDPYFPCADLEKDFGPIYSFSCGRNQPSVLMGRFKVGFDEIVGICLQGTSTAFREACFDSLGFSLASTTDPNQIISGCQKITNSEYAARCAKAAAGELIFQDVPQWQEKSEAVCNSLLTGRDECFAYLDQLIREYGRTKKITFSPLKQDEDLDSYIRASLKVCYDINGQDGCYKQAAAVLYEQFGLAQTLQLLKANENYPEVYARCHEVTHYLSRSEYQKQGSISKVYAQCDSTCHGGCYHGVLEAYLKEQEDKGSYNLSAQFAGVCGKEEDYRSPLEFNECLHGMGHAAMFVTEMDLMESLRLCDNLNGQQSIERCYTGAFMENSSSSTSADHLSRYIKKDDPYYPCNSLEEKYQALCWQYQSSYFAIISNQDFVKVAKMCLQIPDQYQDRCFKTIGTNQVGFTRSLGIMKSNCDKMPSTHFRSICVGGVVSSLSYRFVGDLDKMIEFCNMVDKDSKESCFRQMGTSLLDWSTDKSLARKNCTKIKDPQGLNWCMEVI